MALIKFSNDSKVKIFSKTIFSSSGGGGGVVEPDIFWSGWSSEPSFFDDPVGTITSDGVSNLLISDRTALVYFDSSSTLNGSSGGSVDASNCVNLTYLVIAYAPITSINILGCNSLDNIILYDTQLSQEAIDQVLFDAYANAVAGNISSGQLQIGWSTGNLNPGASEVGWAYKTDLESLGWTVQVKKGFSEGSSGEGGVGLNLL